MPELPELEPPYAVCDDSASVYDLYTGNLKKEIPLTMLMTINLMHGIITYTVTDMKAIVCFHIRRNVPIWLIERPRFQKVRCSEYSTCT